MRPHPRRPRVIATMNAVRVAIGVEAFWGTVRSLETLALILQTCKSVRAECGVAFAVAAMGKDRRVQKVWARRWLGVRAGWWARGGAVTLVGALRLAERRRSVGAAEAHRLADARYMRRLAAFREERARRAELDAYFKGRMQRKRLLERMVAEAGLPAGGAHRRVGGGHAAAVPRAEGGAGRAAERQGARHRLLLQMPGGGERAGHGRNGRGDRVSGVAEAKPQLPAAGRAVPSARARLR